MADEHLFAQYIRILGKGKRGQRSLTQQEAYQAAKMIFGGQVEDIQLGAFLMLMRVKEESPEEIAGFVQAINESLQLPEEMPAVSIDWSSYAGKRRQLPWFILSSQLLVQNGYSVFMHGLTREDERVYAQQALRAIGITLNTSLSDAALSLRKHQFAYLDIGDISPLLKRMIELRQLLGLRGPAHTISRMLNPFSANLQLQGIFHPGYAEIHQQAAQLLGQDNVMVFKGEGGEIERDPDKATLIYRVRNGQASQFEIPAVFTSNTRHLKEDELDLQLFKAVWKGECQHEYGEAAVIATTALTILGLGVTDEHEIAMQTATRWWQGRAELQAA